MLEAQARFAEHVAARLPGFRLDPDVFVRARKSAIVAGWIGELAVVAKRPARPDVVWDWYFARELAVYRAFATTPGLLDDVPPADRGPGINTLAAGCPTGGHEKSTPVRVAPRLVLADADLLVIEHVPGAPLATRRKPRAPLAPDVVAALVALRAAVRARALPRATPTSPAVRRRLRDRLLEEPDEPRWIVDGLATCAHRGIFEPQAATRLAAALAAHPATAPSHGDLLLRNTIARPDGALVLVDWECAGTYPEDWDLALLATQLAPASRAPIEAAVATSPARIAAYRAQVAFAIARELRFLAAFPDPSPREQARLRDELAEAVARV